MRQLLACFCILACSSAIGGDSASLLDFTLKNLREPEFHTLTKYEGKPVLVTFFQPECNWCAKQVRAINKLQEQCDIEAILIGVGGNRVELRRELRRLRPAFPAYQASPELIEALGGVPATPVTLFGDAEGNFLNWSRGFLPGQKLQELMRAFGQTSC